MRFARASLKPRTSGNLHHHAPRYPVRFARASLKHVKAGPEPRIEVWLSRAFCAGLIEAANTEDITPFAVRLSRAFCAGLIEANELLFRLTSAFAVIPCVLRGPH